jgi:L-alanine-DL-glutamate epimerase-like enolase superfamily enzyme
MRISEVEITEFTYSLADVSMYNDHPAYSPGDTLEPSGFVLTIRTDDGVEGNYRGFMFTPPMVTQVEMIAAEYLLGRDPLEREGIWQDLWGALRHTDRLGIGPVDVALWDLAGKYHDASVSTLLGGYRDRIPAYASTYWADDAGGLDSPEAYADFAEACRDRGYPGFKLHPFGDPDRDIAACRAVAEAVGDDMALMLDAGSEYDTYAASLRVGRALDDLDFFWYEDPMADAGESVELGRKLVRELDIPILGVENVRGGPFSRANHIQAGALELVRSDAHLDGGITGVMKTAALAESFGVDVELHVGGPSHLHCLSAVRNTNYYEKGLVHPDVTWTVSQGFTENVEEIDDDGAVPVPDGPGLGVEIDWAFVDERTTDRTVIDETGPSGRI